MGGWRRSEVIRPTVPASLEDETAGHASFERFGGRTRCDWLHAFGVATVQKGAHGSALTCQLPQDPRRCAIGRHIFDAYRSKAVCTIQTKCDIGDTAGSLIDNSPFRELDLSNLVGAHESIIFGGLARLSRLLDWFCAASETRRMDCRPDLRDNSNRRRA